MRIAGGDHQIILIMRRGTNFRLAWINKSANDAAGCGLGCSLLAGDIANRIWTARAQRSHQQGLQQYKRLVRTQVEEFAKSSSFPPRSGTGSARIESGRRK